MGQNASPEGRAELRQPGTALIGSVAYFPEKYGAPDHRRSARHPAPPSGASRRVRQASAAHAENVNHVYPNDELMQLPVAGPA